MRLFRFQASNTHEAPYLPLLWAEHRLYVPAVHFHLPFYLLIQDRHGLPGAFNCSAGNPLLEPRHNLRIFACAPGNDVAPVAERTRGDVCYNTGVSLDLPTESAYAGRRANMKGRRPVKRASFMGLPVELRLHIYSYISTPPMTAGRCLQDKERVTYTCWDAPPKRTQRPIPMAILAANRQVFAEAVPVLYSSLQLHIYAAAPPTSQRTAPST